MSDFITATLEEKEDGATYQDFVWDYFLLFRHSSGEVISVFDSFVPISEDMQVGMTYEIILCPLFHEVISSESNQINEIQSQDTRVGKIVDMNWKAKEGSFWRSGTGVYKEGWMLVATSIGHMIVSPHRVDDALQSKPKIGDIITMKKTDRLDLCAVVKG